MAGMECCSFQISNNLKGFLKHTQKLCTQVPLRSLLVIRTHVLPSVSVLWLSGIIGVHCFVLKSRFYYTSDLAICSKAYDRCCDSSISTVVILTIFIVRHRQLVICCALIQVWYDVTAKFGYIYLVGDLSATKSPASLEQKICQRHVSDKSATCLWLVCDLRKT